MCFRVSWSTQPSSAEQTAVQMSRIRTTDSLPDEARQHFIDDWMAMYVLYAGAAKTLVQGNIGGYDTTPGTWHGYSGSTKVCRWFYVDKRQIPAPPGHTPRGIAPGAPGPDYFSPGAIHARPPGALGRQRRCRHSNHELRRIRPGKSDSLESGKPLSAVHVEGLLLILDRMSEHLVALVVADELKRMAVQPHSKYCHADKHHPKTD